MTSLANRQGPLTDTKMSDGLAKTFQLLKSTSNPQSQEVLLSALDQTDDRIRLPAAETLIARGNTRAHVEIVRRLESFPPAMLDLLRARAGDMETALRQSLLQGNVELCRSALHFVRVVEAYGQFPHLLTLLSDRNHPLSQETAETIRALVHRLYDELHSEQEKSREAVLAHTCHQVLMHIDQATTRFQQLAFPEEVVEGALILGDVEHFAVRKILWQSVPECRELAGRLLLTSRHPGVMQIIVDSLSQSYPHPKVFDAIQSRDDPEFISHLLRQWPRKPTTTQHKNLRQIESLAWVRPEQVQLDVVPPTLQGALVAFIGATGLPRTQKTAVQEWLLRFGSPEGRVAATEGASLLDQGLVQNVVLESLDSEDESVQAWATAQLRSWDVPGAFALLVERLDSPLESVREAARHELEDFNLDRLILIADRLDPESGLAAGRLVLKVDPDAVGKLRRELMHPIRQRRIRAAQASAVLGLQQKVFSSLALMLEDCDTIVRRAAAEVLGTIPTPEAAQALQGLMKDSSPRVRETAQRALRQIQAAREAAYQNAELVVPTY